MTTEKAFEDELLEMIREIDEDIRKTEQRIAATEKKVTKLKEKRIGYQLTLDGYRAKYGLTAEPIPMREEEIMPYRELSTKQMVVTWAVAHNREINMQEACDFLTRGSLFQTARQAAGALYTAAKRLGFKQVKRGVYRMPDEEQPSNIEQSEGDERSIDVAANQPKREDPPRIHRAMPSGPTGTNGRSVAQHRANQVLLAGSRG